MLAGTVLLHLKPEEFNQAILEWFEQHGRKDLPWQQNPTPYRVWVSEIMLQQTQVATVIPYYLKFMAAYPELSDLADATDEDVMALWSGLGYYSRARNLLKTARILAKDKPSLLLPDNQQQLEALPGIGRSTAGAILALSMGKKAAILDGNVKRVLARCFRVSGWPGKASVNKALWQLAEQLTPDTRVNQYTQAMMDLGATLCRRSQPDCEACPLRDHCLAKQSSVQTDYPEKKKKNKLPEKHQYFYLLMNKKGELLMEKRAPTGIWGGLWTPLTCTTDEDSRQFLQQGYGIELGETQKLDVFRHSFSHFHLHIHPVRATVKEYNAIGESNLGWNTVEQWLLQGIPSAVKNMLMQISEQNKPID